MPSKKYKTFADLPYKETQFDNYEFDGEINGVQLSITELNLDEYYVVISDKNSQEVLDILSTNTTIDISKGITVGESYVNNLLDYLQSLDTPTKDLLSELTLTDNLYSGKIGGHKVKITYYTKDGYYLEVGEETLPEVIKHLARTKYARCKNEILHCLRLLKNHPVKKYLSLSDIEFEGDEHDGNYTEWGYFYTNKKKKLSICKDVYNIENSYYLLYLEKAWNTDEAKDIIVSVTRNTQLKEEELELILNKLGEHFLKGLDHDIDKDLPLGIPEKYTIKPFIDIDNMFQKLIGKGKSIYLVQRPNYKKGDKLWEEYDSFVCVVESEEEARKMHPMSDETTEISIVEQIEDYEATKWFDHLENKGFYQLNNSWVSPENICDLKVTRIGSGEGESRIVLASYHNESVVDKYNDPC